MLYVTTRLVGGFGYSFDAELHNAARLPQPAEGLELVAGCIISTNLAKREDVR